MSFLHPWLLAGLLAAGVPVFLHLIQRREPPTVLFPAVRYLVTTTREHQRRLRIQHWLLLLLRTLLVVALVLAAAGPSLPRAGVGTHAPAALVVVLDNSASSAAVVDGTPRLEQLRRAALAALAAATPDDALWLVLADGVPRRGDAAQLAALVRAATPLPRRLDLGEAVRGADQVLASERKPGGILVVSDLQATALGPAAPRVPVTVARPEGAVPRNAGIAGLAPGPQPWPPEGGRVTVTLAGDSALQVPVSVALAGRPPRQALGTVGSAVSVPVPAAAPGWRAVEAAIDPDELRLDDRRVGAVRVAPLARLDCRDGGRHVAAACEVLVANGRAARGDEVRVGAFGATASVVLPPEDPALAGALNRELERRGVAWRYGGPLPAAATDSGALLGRVAVTRRLRLVAAGSGRTGVLATAGGEPWLVRSGRTVLVGSRLDPAWTALPLTAGFVPFVDVLVNRLARGELAALEAAPGDAVPLPDLVTALAVGDRRVAVEGGAPWRPQEVGLVWLLAGRDTAGVLAVNVDARESRLARASDGRVRALWPGARVVPLGAAGRAAFAGGARSDLRGPLLWLALACAAAELVLASAWGRAR